MGEFDLIERFFKRAARRAVLGIGDDCALMQAPAGSHMAISTDMLVQGRHFFADVDPRTLGHKALAVNLSDLAACGAEPMGFTLALALPHIEERWLAAFAEGLAIFEAADEMTPAYDLDIPAITEVWRRGSVVASWLLDLTAQALVESEELSEYSTEVSDSGEGRWTVQAAIEAGIPAHVLSASLYARFASRNNDEFANRVLSAMRYKFGGHNEKPKA